MGVRDTVMDGHVMGMGDHVREMDAIDADMGSNDGTIDGLLMGKLATGTR